MSTPGLPSAFGAVGTASFLDFLRMHDPSLLPDASVQGSLSAPVHGTTIVSATCAGGVVMAGDRRATMGNVIAQRDIEKVFAADEHSVIGIAGTAGIALELVRLFQVELQHYEKIEGVPLSLDGKANRLATLLRSNLGLAMQGLAVVPMFAGVERAHGRLFSYDVTGGRYEEHDFYAVGSGAYFAKGSLKKLYRSELTIDETVRVLLEALYDAADDDSATGGPDLARRIFPVVAVVTAEGVRVLSNAELGAVVEAIVAERLASPDGPTARIGGAS